MAVTYAWKKTFRLRGRLDATAVGKELDELRKQHGEATPKRMWRKAQSDSSAMHGGFTWNIHKAAEERWEEQARYILQHHILDTVDDVKVEGEVRSTHFILGKPTSGTKPDGGVWVHTADEMRTDEGRKTLLNMALRELAQFKQKYSWLEELANVFEAIDGALGGGS